MVKKHKHFSEQHRAFRHGPLIIFLGLLLLGATFVSTTTGEQAAGTVVISVQATASLKFALNTVDFGIGFVNTTGGNQVCVLDTEGTNSNTRCINFTTVTQGFVLENDGNINLTVDLLSNKNASVFIGGNSTLSAFRWKVSQNETGSCGNITFASSYVDVNTTSPGTRICNTFSGGIGGFNSRDTNDSLRIDLNITIPYDALAGTRNATITATGTAA